MAQACYTKATQKSAQPALGVEQQKPVFKMDALPVADIQIKNTLAPVRKPMLRSKTASRNSIDYDKNSRVLFATSELYPFVKTGGLGDVSASLPPALAAQGIDIRYFVPGYTAIKNNLAQIKTIHVFPELFGQSNAKLISGILPSGLKAYVLDIPAFYERAHPYLDENKKDWADNHLRFGAFCYAAAHIADYDTGWQPDVFHGNDWQCGLISAYKALDQVSPLASSILTIHNIGYQGLFPAEKLSELMLPEQSFSVFGVEYYGQIGFLKAGIYYSDHLTTVSPTYAQEICNTALGCGLEGLLLGRRNKLTGILNGISDNVWNTLASPFIRFPYSNKALATRKKNKRVVLKEMGLKNREEKPLFAFIGRLAPQKGIDIMLGAMASLLEQDISLIIMGIGDQDLADACHALAEKHPDKMSVLIGFDEGLEHRFYAGADALLVPSHFEPCGLVQLNAMRYGALPVVRRTGGLADSVTQETGFIFDLPTAQDLEHTLQHVIDLYNNAPEKWKEMQKAGMGMDFSWQVASKKYQAIYTSLKKTVFQQSLLNPYLL